MIYTISLIGCDDETAFEMELNDKEVPLVRVMCLKSVEASSFSCMPIMELASKRDDQEGK